MGELVLLVPPSPRNFCNLPVSMMFTPQPLVTPELPRTSSRLLSPPSARPTDTSPLISGPRLRALPLLSPTSPRNSKNTHKSPLDAMAPEMDKEEEVAEAAVVAVVVVALAVAVVVAVPENERRVFD